MIASAPAPVLDALAYYKDECARLQACLIVIRDCQDQKCTLCGRCLQATCVPLVLADPPEIAVGDSLRGWTYRTLGRRPKGWRSR